MVSRPFDHTYRGGAPSRNSHDGALRGFSSLSRNADGVGVGIEVEGGADSPEGDVVLVGFDNPVSGDDFLDDVSGSRVVVYHGTSDHDVVRGGVTKQVARLKLLEY